MPIKSSYSSESVLQFNFEWLGWRWRRDLKDILLLGEDTLHLRHKPESKPPILTMKVLLWTWLICTGKMGGYLHIS